MVVAAQNTNNTTIRSILLSEKLNGMNFTNWYRNLRVVLRYEKKIKFVKQPIGPAPDPDTANPDTIDKYYESVSLEQEVVCLMLSRKEETVRGKVKAKGKNKLAYAPKTKIPLPPKRDNPAKDSICHH
nr:hypothetical protein [Tanacetum cinerariifolium]